MINWLPRRIQSSLTFAVSSSDIRRRVKFDIDPDSPRLKRLRLKNLDSLGHNPHGVSVMCMNFSESTCVVSEHFMTSSM